MQNAIEVKCDEVQTSLPKRAKAIPWTCRSSFHLGSRVRDTVEVSVELIVESKIQKSSTGTGNSKYRISSTSYLCNQAFKIPTFNTHRRAWQLREDERRR
jgi:hypothetical protein